MTSKEWDRARKIAKMLAVLQVASNDRKIRLFAIACCRQVPEWSDDKRILRALGAAEQFANGELTEDELRKQFVVVHRAHNALLNSVRGLNTKKKRAESLILLSCMSLLIPSPPREKPTAEIQSVVGGLIGDFDDEAEAALGAAVVTRFQILFPQLLRDIFGNPFRSVAFSSERRTDTAITLASQMYESREFSAMPILADALQDAGCTNEDILSHCRDPKQVHVRGCWVVDLVLGKA